ncbi:disheveled-associated activator of morphogenesis 1-like [Brachionus plicatilis]|uniref:Disheveled-associated activator of morphogenesis 1-like n=1 Tax=Brachionus plicatilis TaxID=10195 RepID=A0A3M7QRP8_BRAPC|nr:disheveled-associated activator of morphogenesis 1-like [Brachionus plicatilis]
MFELKIQLFREKKQKSQYSQFNNHKLHCVAQEFLFNLYLNFTIPQPTFFDLRNIIFIFLLVLDTYIKFQKILNLKCQRVFNIEVEKNFVDTFLQKKGLDAVVDLLSSLKYEWRHHTIHFNLIHCVRGILNCNSGCSAVLNHERALSILVQSLYVSDVKLKVKVIEIISPLCLWNIGREKILGAFTQFKEYARESYRFQYIVNLLAFYDGFDESLNEKLKVSILSLINLIIGDKNSQKEDDLAERLLIRMEFIKLGLQDIVSDLIREKPSLDKHLDYYEFSRITDESCFLEFSKDQSHSANVYMDSKCLFDNIERKVKLTSVNLNWHSVLEHLFVLTTSKQSPKMEFIWHTIDQMVSLVVLGEKKIEDFDDILAKIGQNMQLLEEIKNLSSRLERSEEEARNLRAQNGSLMQEVIDLRDKLSQQSKITEMKENLNKRVLSSSTPKQNSKKLNVFKQPDELNDIDLSLLTPNTSGTFFPCDTPPAPPPPPPPLPTIAFSIQKKNMDSLYSLPVAPKSIFTDPMRSISVSVARRKLPSSDELVDIIETMDPEQKLGETEISNLQQLVLSGEEKVNLYSCNLSQMDELHNCLYKMSKIMHYSEKLEIIRFKNSLRDHTTSQLSGIKSCCSSLKENKSILKFFELLLCIVNYVNQNNQNGNAFGFKLNFLNKLGEIKTNERGLSLLHCLIMMIKDNHPELMKLPEELESVKNMAVFNITDLSNEILNLEKSYNLTLQDSRQLLKIDDSIQLNYLIKCPGGHIRQEIIISRFLNSLPKLSRLPD